MPKGRLDAVDGLRAAAVLLVVAHHGGLIPYAYGARGVDLFFILSGFCLALPSLRRLRAGEPLGLRMRAFFANRVRRIVPPYYAALALFVVLASTSFGFPSVKASAYPFEWLADALFLTSQAPAYNASFWTLGVEARWYLAFPLVLALYVQSKRGFAAVACAAYLLYVARPDLLDAGTFPAFMLGIVAADLFVRERLKSPLIIPGALVALALAVALDHGEDQGDPLWHLAAFALVLAGVGPLARIFSQRTLAFVGGASYSIYLIHQPVLLWLARYGVSLPLCAAVSVAAGLAFWFAVERPALLVWKPQAGAALPSKSRTSAANCSSYTS